jgi:putative membrane protein insertion efficiency factor
MRQLPKLVALQLLRAYKWAVSPLFPPSCRYVPTCSEYAMEAVERYGVLRGGMVAALRLLRCHPFAKGGHDPVIKHPVVERSFAPGERHEGPTTTSDQRRLSAPSYGVIRGNI